MPTFNINEAAAFPAFRKALPKISVCEFTYFLPSPFTFGLNPRGSIGLLADPQNPMEAECPLTQLMLYCGVCHEALS